MNRVVDLHEPAPTRDWASEKAHDILRRLRWTDWLTSQDYLAAELRLIRNQGVGEGIDQLGAQLMKGTET